MTPLWPTQAASSPTHGWTRAEILLLKLQAQMGKPRRAIERLESLVPVHESTAGRTLLALARTYWAARDVDAVSRVLRRIVTSHPAAPVPVLIDALLLSSEVADAEGHETRAVEAATTAQLATADRIVLPFISAGPRLQGLLHRHAALTNLWPSALHDTPERWARALPAHREDSNWQALTEREVSILNWLTTTMTMAEIASELYVSTNTVKTHVAAIYRKLEANNRREAIARGRQHHLI